MAELDVVVVSSIGVVGAADVGDVVDATPDLLVLVLGLGLGLAVVVLRAVVGTGSAVAGPAVVVVVGGAAGTVSPRAATAAATAPRAAGRTGGLRVGCHRESRLRIGLGTGTEPVLPARRRRSCMPLTSS